MSNLARILDLTVGRPLLITPEKATVILNVITGRVALPAAAIERDPAAAAASDEAPDPVEAKLDQIVGHLGLGRPEPGAYRPIGSADRYGRALPLYPVINGVAQITIDGSLVNRGAYIGASSGLVSYEGIRSQIRQAVADDQAKAILLDLNSPGGQASGMFTIAAEVRQAAQKKPVIAFVNDMAASAAYGIASGASEIIVSPSSLVGSIGVVLMHLDRSREMDAKGIATTLIHAGAHKVDGNPFEPLPEGVRASLQAEVNDIYDLFLDTVAEGRGRKLSKKAARDTQAKIFSGQKAVDAGLADAVASLDQVFEAIAAGKKVSTLSRPNPKGAAAMAEENTQPAAVAPAPVANADAGVVKARIKAITTSAEAQGREALASHLAFDTDMSVDDAKKVLALAPAAASAGAVEQKPNPQAYVEQKAQAGAIGVAAIEPAPTKADAAKAGWAKAVANINRHVA